MIYIGIFLGILITSVVSKIYTLYKNSFRKNLDIYNAKTQEMLTTITSQLRESSLANAITIEVADKLANQDRAQTKILEVLMRKLNLNINDNTESLGRIEFNSAKVAADLENSHNIAINTVGPPGSQADAAASTITYSKGNVI